ncbi:hypothetical protein Pla144_12590 [Bythopirellula polymerisocia]|uniref:Uncharacterized protein n=1 Tax=Bythopirellula polymerisocia TaxID=2528003 RepID=A0A5C6D0P3_9BACT|nr:hypothetical protein Pla144_12590 [Bythopirellula polymerisocia]
MKQVVLERVEQICKFLLPIFFSVGLVLLENSLDSYLFPCAPSGTTPCIFVVLLRVAFFQAYLDSWACA